MLNSLPTTTTTPPTPSLVTSVSTPSHYLETIHRFRTLCFSLPSLVSQRDLSKIQWTSTQLKECLTILKKSPIHQETGSSKESSTTTHTSSSSSTTSTSFPLPSSTLASTSTTPPRPSSLPNSTTPFHLQILSSTLCEVTLHNSVLVRIHHEGSRGPWITEIEVTLVGGGGGGGGSLSSSSTSGEVSVSPPPPSTTPVSTCDWQVRKNLEKPHVLHRLDRLAQQSWVLEKTSLGKVLCDLHLWKTHLFQTPCHGCHRILKTEGTGMWSEVFPSFLLKAPDLAHPPQWYHETCWPGLMQTE